MITYHSVISQLDLETFRLESTSRNELGLKLLIKDKKEPLLLLRKNGTSYERLVSHLFDRERVARNLWMPSWTRGNRLSTVLPSWPSAPGHSPTWNFCSPGIPTPTAYPPCYFRLSYFSGHSAVSPPDYCHRFFVNQERFAVFARYRSFSHILFSMEFANSWTVPRKKRTSPLVDLTDL